MGKGVVKGGTPIGSASLCQTCSYAHIMTGYRESELVTMCNEIHPNIVVPFVIYECSNYYDKNRPSWEQMEKFAIDLSPGPSKPRGFRVGTGFTSQIKNRNDDDCDDD